MEKLTFRQQAILQFIRENSGVNNQQIRKHLEKSTDSVGRVTIVRDIDILLRANLITKQGEGRSVVYIEKTQSSTLTYIDVDKYFEKGPDERILKSDSFNYQIFSDLKDLFSQTEIKELSKLNNEYQKRIKKLSTQQIKKEFERLTIELSWKSSQIEGNTYSLIDTEILIKEKQEAQGHKKEEAVMILNHKSALDYIWQKDKYFQKLDLRKIEDIHKLIVQDLSVATGLRKRIVGIVGTKYKPLDNYQQIKEAVENTTKLINSFSNPFSKALTALLMISYIQPFEDGNKRTARLLADAMLIAHDICPLSYRSINEADYKKAVILFYEQNNARFFKELFIEQLKFAINNYFL